MIIITNVDLGKYFIHIKIDTLMNIQIIFNIPKSIIDNNITNHFFHTDICLLFLY